MDAGVKIMKVPMKRARVEALLAIHEWMIGEYVPENNHEHLLHAHLVAMYWELDKMLAKHEQQKFTLFITERDAMAFCLLWGNEKMSMARYGAVQVVEIIKLIDKTAVRQREPGKKRYAKRN